MEGSSEVVRAIQTQGRVTELLLILKYLLTIDSLLSYIQFSRILQKVSTLNTKPMLLDK